MDSSKLAVSEADLAAVKAASDALAVAALDSMLLCFSPAVPPVVSDTWR
jgi:hypothetical protein